jgi:hypothetical protein
MMAVWHTYHQAEDPFHKVDKKFKGMKGKKVADGFLTRAPAVQRQPVPPQNDKETVSALG